MNPPDPKQVYRSPKITRLALQLAKDPKSKAFIPLAEEYVRLGMLKEAVAVLEEGLKVYPNFITALVALGRAYQQMGEAAKAKTLLEDSIRLSPDNLLAHRSLAQIYVEEDALEAAKKSCTLVLAQVKDEGILALKAIIEQRLKGEGTARASHLAQPVPSSPRATSDRPSARAAPSAIEPLFPAKAGGASIGDTGLAPNLFHAAPSSAGRPSADAIAQKVARLRVWLAKIRQHRVE
ncbi:MAG: tetratricopeptide repeat protein [Nitrospiraceae bacterium]